MANYEQLFLLEVLVDKVRLLTQALAAFAPEVEDEEDTPVRIRIKFSDFPCFEITQDLAPPDPAARESNVLITPIDFSSGKSCMFPMDPEQLIQDLIKYPMAVTVFKKNSELPMPDIIGQSKIPLGNYMTTIIEKAAEWNLAEPISEVLQDMFPLRNSMDQDVGTIKMLIRLTCFGKTIITKFQIADNKKSFLFRNAKVKDYEFQCKKCKPGQPILRPPPVCEEYGEYDDDLEEVPLKVDKEAMTDDYKERPKDSHFTGPGFQKHRVTRDDFTATMEVKYPEGEGDSQDEFEPPCGGSQSGGTRSSRSATVVRKKKKTSGKRGKSADMSKTSIEFGVELEKQKKKRKSKFHVERDFTYPGVVLGHRNCIGHGGPVPACNGWAWRSTVPEGMKPDEFDGWVPGAYMKDSWRAIQQEKKERLLKGIIKPRKKAPQSDMRKPTIHLHRENGIYHVTMNPVVGPGEEEKEPLVYTLDRPEEDSEGSEVEFDVTVPEPRYPGRPLLRHQEQQFREEDLPLRVLPPVKIKKREKTKQRKLPKVEYKPQPKKKPAGKGGDKGKGKGGKDKGKGKGKGKDGKPRKKCMGDDVYPWDNWILTLKCRYDSTLKRAKGWVPGTIPDVVLDLIEKTREDQGLPPSKFKPKNIAGKVGVPAEPLQRIENRPPTIHVHRHKGAYHVTMYNVVQPGEEYQDIPQPLKVTINRPDLDSEYDSESDLEFEFNVPEPDLPVARLHQETQFRAKDLPPAPPPKKKPAGKGK